MTRFAAIALMLLCTGLGACSGKSGRVTMRLDPGWDCIVRIDGKNPETRVENKGPGDVVVDVSANGFEERLTIMAEHVHDATLSGPVRFAFVNEDDEETIVELRAIRYRGIVVERSPQERGTP